MIFDSVRVQGYRSIADSGRLPLGPVTVLTGQNNGGKSAVMRAIYSLQSNAPFQQSDVRIGQSHMQLELAFPELPRQLRFMLTPGVAATGPGVIRFLKNGTDTSEAVIRLSGGEVPISPFSISSVEPRNLVFPVLSGRKVTFYREQVSSQSAHNVHPTDVNLVSRVMDLSGPTIGEGVKFRRLCQDVLGLNFIPLTGENGQQGLGVQVDRFTSIPLESMGAGLSGALNLLLGLSVATNQLFLIEEPEADLHPTALKRLLAAIADASGQNQFIISTHSNIVLTALANVPNLKVIHVVSDNAIPPSSSYSEVVGTDARIKVLQDLGYSLADFDLGQGWIIFEESSAERIVRSYLAPWFAPGILRLRTLAAQGTSRVGPLFRDFHEMFLFAHLEPVYRNRAWVITDGDPAGVEVIEKLKSSYQSWPEEHFRTWPRNNFEEYYPSIFADRVKITLKISDRQRLREEKKKLLEDVINWIDGNPGTARDAFAESAAEVISLLQEIEQKITP